jgi:hypothetical protein
MNAKTKSASAKSTTEPGAEPQGKQKAVRISRLSTAPTVYVEGVSQMVLGFPTSRVIFFSGVNQDTSVDPPTETHLQACELIIPTAALAEASLTILTHMIGTKSLLEKGRAEWSAKVQHVMDQLDLLQLPTSAGQKKAD